MSNIGKQGIKIHKQLLSKQKPEGGLVIKITSYKPEVNKNEIKINKFAGEMAESLGARPSIIKRMLQMRPTSEKAVPHLKRILLERGLQQKSLFFPSIYEVKLVANPHNQDEYELQVHLPEEYALEKIWRKYWGSFRANLANALQGILEGFTYTLKIKGVGYRASVQEGKLNLNLGFSHPIQVNIPEYVQVEIIGNAGTEIKISGENKEKTSQWVHQVRLIKPSSKDHYKGAGLYLG